MRIGLIGIGYIGNCYSRALSAVNSIYPELPTLRLAGLCETDNRRLEAAKRQGRFEIYSNDWRQFLSEGDLDVVIIATPSHLHKDISVEALHRNIHVLCEKPMAIELRDAYAMACAAKVSAAKTLLGYSYIHNPAIKHMKRLIDDGHIGKVISFHGHFAEDYLADRTLPHTWRCIRTEAGLGALADLGCHIISVSQYLVGNIAEVSALTNIAYLQRPAPGEHQKKAIVTNEDIAKAIVTFENGVPGTFEASRVAWGSKNRLLIEVQGSQGALRFDQERMNEVALYDSRSASSCQGFTTILTAPDHAPYGRFIPSPGHQLGFVDLKAIEIGEFLLEICGEGLTGPNFESGYLIEQAIHAMAKSARDRKWISVAHSKL